MPENSGRLADNVVYFARALRAAGMPVGPRAVIDALEALTIGGIGSHADFYWTLHAVFVKRHEHSLLFDQAFKLFFRKRASLERLLAALMPQVEARREVSPPASQRVIDALFTDERARKDRQEIEMNARLTTSDQEILEKKDFAQMSAVEIAEARQAIRKLVLPLDERRTRRLAPARHGCVIDMRRTLRASMKGGGATIDLKYFARRMRRPPIVALLDISGSMSEYTRLFLHFLHAVTDARKRVSTFLFGTRLTNVSRVLRTRDPDEALASVSAYVSDWSGGTRIATSLATFNKLWSRRVLGQGAIVLLITDGLERDVGDRLSFEMDRLRRSSSRVIWLNPLLRFGGFEVKASGIKAILPRVDELRPIHNLRSMAELCRALSGSSAAQYEAKEWLKKVA